MTINQDTFTGEYSYTIDAKGRVNIPAKFRQSLAPENDQTFVITQGMDLCIWVYPLTAWQIIEDDLKDLSAISKVNRSFIRNTVRYASTVTFDKQGRIILSSNLMNYAKLKKDALIIGMVNKIEIWDPTLLAKVDKKNLEMDSSKYDELADRIIL
uniref:Transcriptional regulator MraZ n=1 Tax=uncultured marine group II/III euryarchaeote KM3_94_C01 TaxID=1456545 RepID=A0A075HWV2_9EURY|nr:cell division protein (mraZ) [uncultured marine group II/III euryarchaeote KM3_94_C01]